MRWGQTYFFISYFWLNDLYQPLFQAFPGVIRFGSMRPVSRVGFGDLTKKRFTLPQGLGEKFKILIAALK